MAKSKAKKEEESIFDALALLEKEMNIPSDYMIEKISNAIRIALKKSNNGNDDIQIRIEPDNKIFSVFIRKTVVEEVKDNGREVLLDVALKYDPLAEIGSVVAIKQDPKQFGRIAAQYLNPGKAEIKQNACEIIGHVIGCPDSNYIPLHAKSLFAEKFLLFAVVGILAAHAFVERLQQISLLIRKPRGHLNDKRYILIAAHFFVMNVRNTLSAKTDLRIGLGSGFQVINDIAVDGRNDDVSAERRLRKRYRLRRIQIVSVSLQERMSLHDDINQKASALAAVHAGLTHIRNAHALSFVDSGRNRNADGLTVRHIARAVTVFTFFTDDLTGTATVRTGLLVLNDTENRLLRENDGALSFTSRTGFRTCAGLCPASVTGLADILQIQLQILFTAEYRLFKRNTDRSTHACAASRSIASLRASSASAEHVAEAEHIENIGKAAREIISTAAGAAALIKGIVSVLIV